MSGCALLQQQPWMFVQHTAKVLNWMSVVNILYVFRLVSLSIIIIMTSDAEDSNINRWTLLRFLVWVAMLLWKESAKSVTNEPEIKILNACQCYWLSLLQWHQVQENSRGYNKLWENRDWLGKFQLNPKLCGFLPSLPPPPPPLIFFFFSGSVGAQSVCWPMGTYLNIIYLLIQHGGSFMMIDESMVWRRVY